MDEKMVKVGLPSPTRNSESQKSPLQEQPDVNIIHLEATNYFENRGFTEQDIQRYTLDKYNINLAEHVQDMKRMTRSASRSNISEKEMKSGALVGKETRETNVNKRSLAEEESAPSKKSKVAEKEKISKDPSVEKAKDVKEKEYKDVAEKKVRAAGKKPKKSNQENLRVSGVNDFRELKAENVQQLEVCSKPLVCPEIQPNPSPVKKSISAKNNFLTVTGKKRPIVKKIPEIASKVKNTGILGAANIKIRNDPQIISVNESSAQEMDTYDVSAGNPPFLIVKALKAGNKAEVDVAKPFKGKAAEKQQKMTSKKKPKAASKIIDVHPKKRGRPPGKKSVNV